MNPEEIDFAHITLARFGHGSAYEVKLPVAYICGVLPETTINSIRISSQTH